MDAIFSPDCPVLIVEGGTSLRGFGWSRLRCWPCVAVNTAFRAVPHADTSFGDDRLVAWHNDAGGEHFWRYRGPHLLTTAVSFTSGINLPDGRPARPSGRLTRPLRRRLCACTTRTGGGAAQP